MCKFYRKSQRQSSFDFEHHDEFLRCLSSDQNPYSTLQFSELNAIPFEYFRPEIEASVVGHSHKKRKGGNAGRPAFDPVYIFKALCFMRRCGDSFKSFHGKMLCDRRVQALLDIQFFHEVPSYQTLYRYDQIFTETELYEQVFRVQVDTLQAGAEKIGTVAQACDGSFAVAPRQRNTKEENELIKVGKGEQLWNDKPNKKRHKDIDARWTKKGDETFFGYKLHASVCVLSKIIVHCHTTAANVHDAKGIPEIVADLPPNKIVDPKIREHEWGMPKLFADSGYVGKAIEEAVYSKGWKPVICAKGTRGRPLTEEEKFSNREASKVRSRVEHSFGFIERSMGGLVIRSVNIKRACARNFLTCFVYNMCRVGLILKRQT